jgi:dTDP-4-dehydrorhamnose 3,5-epimerase
LHGTNRGFYQQMEIREKRIKGVYEIILSPNIDKRGFFMRTYDRNFFQLNGLDREWLQENHSRSEKKGIIRGMHFQLAPFTEGKLVRCIKGAILDVFIDLRQNSESFGQWDSIELSELNKKEIFIPRGFAHGFCTLTDISEVVYKVDNIYSKDHERGIIWNDGDLKINWPVLQPILSDKDMNNLTFREFCSQYGYL